MQEVHEVHDDESRTFLCFASQASGGKLVSNSIGTLMIRIVSMD